jgi:hypothetical protein
MMNHGQTLTPSITEPNGFGLWQFIEGNYFITVYCINGKIVTKSLNLETGNVE